VQNLGTILMGSVHKHASHHRRGQHERRRSPGIIVGDKYSMVVYYNPTQAPSSTSGADEAFYSGFTLNARSGRQRWQQEFLG
jgi:hypothetical protein